MLGRTAVVLVAGLLVGGAGQLLAQSDRARAATDSAGWGDRLDVRQGFWISFGFGGGWDLDREEAGGAGYIRLGGTVDQRLLVGGEVLGVFREESGADVSVGNVTFSVLYYPSGGFFVKGGLGFASREVSVSQGDVTVSTSSEGFGLTLGGGYDIRLARNFFLTPGVDVMLQTIEDGNVALALTLGATWH